MVAIHRMPIEQDNPDCSVRVAGPSDVQAIVSMCRTMHAETAIRDDHNALPPFNEGKVSALVGSAMTPSGDHSQSGSWIGVIGQSDDIRASAFLMVQVPWSTDHPYLGIVWTFVKPEWRFQSKYVKALIAFSRTEAKRLNLRPIGGVMGTGPAMERLYERSGAVRLGGLFTFD